MPYKKLFSNLSKEMRTLEDGGKIASYIPELRNVDPDKFGIHLVTLDNKAFSLGDSNEKFSIQSIAKVLSLTLALKLDDKKLWDRVGVEPSGSSFNSMVQLEYEKGIPRNPFINAGALVVCDILVSHLKEDPQGQFIEYVRSVVGDPDVDYCSKVSESEKRTGFGNAALINFMKSFGNIKNDIDRVLGFYCDLCSIEMSCKQLAQTFLYLVCNGIHPVTREKIISIGQSKRINAIMQLCGFYDEAGEFAFKVGLPGKSGVGGGIIAVHPGEFSVAVWSPRLNKKGNSFRGMKVLEYITSRTQSSIF